MTDKTFTVTGVSCVKGKYKVRFGNDMSQRMQVLTKINTDVQLMSLDHPMTKPEIVNFLKTSELYLNETYRAAIDRADQKYNPAVKVKRTRVSNKQAQPAWLNSKDAGLDPAFIFLIMHVKFQ